MGTVIDLKARREPKKSGNSQGRFVACMHCGERHPLVRMTDGTVRCLTAFADGARWFCRNRGCRATWLEHHPAPK
jgi:hypothetical protein